MMDKIKHIKDKWYTPFLLILLISLPTMAPLVRPGYFPTQDYIYVARIYQMEKAIVDGHLPVRWVKDFRNGEPLYNFYAPLPYYVGALIHLFPNLLKISFSYLLTVKILFGLAFVLSAISMFLFSRKIFGIFGAIVSATLYLYAPYHSVDIYVRGALSEAWSLIFFPLIFWLALNLSQKNNFRNFLLLTLSLTGLFFTHNVMTMIFAPFILAWMVFLLFRSKRKILLFQYLGSLIWSISLGATFLLPAFFEKNFVTTDELTRGYFDFRGHFVAIKQWFEPTWGYGASLWGPKDDMSFQIGFSLWGGLLMSLLVIFLSLIYLKHKKIKFLQKVFWQELDFKNWINNFVFFTFVSLLYLFSLFMMHNKSTFIWEGVETLKFTQFPWRFLGISIFFISILGGYSGLLINKRLFKYVVAPLVVIIISLNIGYFRPDSFYLDSIDEHYVGDKVISRNDRLPKDYLPIWVKKLRDEKLREPNFIQGSGEILNFKYKTAFASFKVKSSSSSAIEAPVTYFPGWEVKVNGQPTKILDQDDFGLIRFDLPPGENKVELIFKDTPIRKTANIISLLSFLLLLAVIYRFKKLTKL